MVFKHSRSITDVAITSDAHFAASAVDGKIQLWKLGKEPQPLLLLENGASGNNKLEVDPESHLVTSNLNITTNNRYAIVSSMDYSLYIWDIQTAKCILPPIQGNRHEISATCISSDSRFVVLARGNSLQRWDIKKKTKKGSLLQGHRGTVTDLSISPDGKRVISASFDGTLRIWDLEKGICISSLIGHVSSVMRVRLSPDGRFAISASQDMTLRIWDFLNGKCLGVLSGHRHFIIDLCITRNCQFAVSASMDCTVCVWDIKRKKPLYPALTGHNDAVIGVAVTANDSHIVSASLDGTIRIWDIMNGSCIAVYEAGKGITSGPVLSTEGTILVGTEDGECLFFETHNLSNATAIVTALAQHRT